MGRDQQHGNSNKVLFHAVEIFKDHSSYSHLFLLKYQYVARVETIITIAATKYPCRQVNSGMSRKFMPYHVPIIISGVVMTVIIVNSFTLLRVVRRHIQIHLQYPGDRIGKVLGQLGNVK